MQSTGVKTRVVLLNLHIKLHYSMANRHLVIVKRTTWSKWAGMRHAKLPEPRRQVKRAWREHHVTAEPIELQPLRQRTAPNCM